MTKCKIFAEIDAVQYYDWDFYVLTNDWGNSTYKLEDFATKDDVVPIWVDQRVEDKLSGDDKGIAALCTSVIPPEHSSVYVAPNCIYAREDLRKHFSIKRGVDSGDYNLVHPIDAATSRRKSMYISRCYIYPDCRTIIGVTYYDEHGPDIKTFIKSLFPQFPYHCNLAMFSYNRLERCAEFTEVYQKLLLGTLQKPVILDTKLNLQGSNDITLDTLTILEKACNAGFDSSSVSNLKLQLASINQCRWEEYKGTLRTVWQYCWSNSRYNSCIKTMHGSKSYWNRPITAIMNAIDCFKSDGIYEYQNQADYDLCKAWLDNKLGIDGSKSAMYATIDSVNGKLLRLGVSNDIFNTFYNNIVKLVPKPYAP